MDFVALKDSALYIKTLETIMKCTAEKKVHMYSLLIVV